MSTYQRLPCLLLLALGLAACSGSGTPEAEAPQVGVLTVRPQATTVTAEYVAQLDASNTVEIRARVGGLLEKQMAVEGAAVKKGQVLFVIDRQPYLAALEQAKAVLAQAEAAQQQAERDLARVQPLSELNAVSKQELDGATARERSGRASVQAAQAALRTASLNLEYTTVTAPVDGMVGRAQFRMGGLVTAYQSLLTTLYDIDPMYVNFSIPERRMLELQARFGDKLQDGYGAKDSFRLLLSDGSTYPEPPRLNFIDAAVDRGTGTLPLRLEVANPRGLLRAGQFARVVAVVDQNPQALRVPQRAVQELQGKPLLWVVDAENQVQRRDVRMGARIGGEWVVESGLAAGERIVVDGLQRMRAGLKVDPQPVAVEQAAVTGATQ